MKKFWMLLAAGFVLTGCADAVNEDVDSDVDLVESSAQVTSLKDEDAISVTIHVTEDGKEIENGTMDLEVEEDANLFEIMEANYDIEEENFFINSINGVEQDDEAGKYWLFDVNGEEAMVGANDIKLQDGDLVEWKLEPYTE